MAALQRNQLSRLCSSETFEKAQSILLLANARTRPGSGFVVKNTVAIPAVCAYLASEQYAFSLLPGHLLNELSRRLNTGEVSLQSAMSAACVTRAEFSDILGKVRAALRSEEGIAVANITYATLVDAYHVHPREDAIACMEDAEAALPCVDMLKEKHGANTLSCAVFYWVCQLMEVRFQIPMFERITIAMIYRNPRYRSDLFVDPILYPRERLRPLWLYSTNNATVSQTRSNPIYFRSGVLLKHRRRRNQTTFPSPSPPPQKSHRRNQP